MNLDQYFALHVTSADAKVAYRSYQQEKSNMEAMFADLLAHGNEAVSAEYLREALMLVSRVHAAHLEAVAALVTAK
ncbi:MAG: hypothetical protein EB084_12280 [Proteobacteria bacterium]|nr:hypothetical protein [Pseudomonadota bacterium]